MAKWKLLTVGYCGDGQQLQSAIIYHQIKVSELGFNANTKLPYYVRICPYWETLTDTFHFRYYLYGR